MSYLLPQHRVPMLCPRVQKSHISYMQIFGLGNRYVYSKYITYLIDYKNYIQIQYLYICKGNMLKRRRGRAGGPAAGQGILGGSPKNPSGGHSRALVPPEGGVGGRKSGIQYCINWRVFAQRTPPAVERFSTSIRPREKTVFFENFKKMSLLASKTP